MTPMSDRAFVDTNIWVYTVDAADAVRRRRALAVVGPESGYQVVLSTQVLAEFYAVVTRKLAQPLAPAAARALATQMSEFAVVSVDAPLVLSAFDASVAWGISAWDALIIRAAEIAQCAVLLTEDLADGAMYGSVRVVNPLRDSTPG
jgi:predicted nucleic acid-binding protein